MVDPRTARLRRARQTRIRIRQQDAIRLTVHRTNSHMYAQITTARGDRVLAAASTLEKDVRATLQSGANRGAAEAVGKRIAEKAKAAGIEKVAFDRAGYRYQGRVKVLAEAARAGGLKF
jgi:large subunit ribosomal protein L18